MNSMELARWLGGVDSISNTNGPGRTLTCYGTAMTNSADGKVIVKPHANVVSADGSPEIELDTTDYIEQGKEVLIRIVNGSPVVDGYVGGGDVMHVDIERNTNAITDMLGANLTPSDVNHLITFTQNLSSTNVDGEEYSVIENVYSITAKYATIEQLEVMDAFIEHLEAGTVTAEEIDAAKGVFDEVVAGHIETETITAMDGQFDTIRTRALNVEDLKADHAEIDTLEVNKLDANFGNFDALNAVVAKIQELFAKTGWIETLAVAEGNITGVLKAVKIDADDVSIRNLKADSLIIKGTDGIYYALNVNALGQAAISELTPAEQEALKNGIHGENLIAQTVTANKIYVTDLSAFNAMIAGMKLTDGAIFTLNKTTVDSSIPGFYLNSSGDFCIGDSNNYLRFYKDSNNVWQFQVSLQALTNQIDDASKVATNFLSYDATDGLVVGDQTAGGTITQNVKINSDGVDIREGTTSMGLFSSLLARIGKLASKHVIIDSDGMDIKNNTSVLARFRDSLIELGKSSLNAVITFCNGVLQISAEDASGRAALAKQARIKLVNGTYVSETVMASADNYACHESKSRSSDNNISSYLNLENTDASSMTNLCSQFNVRTSSTYSNVNGGLHILANATQSSASISSVNQVGRSGTLYSAALTTGTGGTGNVAYVEARFYDEDNETNKTVRLKPFYRLTNSYSTPNQFLYTTSKTEKDTLVNAGWTLQGAYYVFA